MKELAEDASVLVEPEDTDSIVGAMATIAGDELLRQQLVERGRERVKAFDWARCAAGTLRVLEAAAQGCARPARFARA